mmetsp:Transcript_22372/g.56975  ORF Transcript_22372/g.56975 Transcript_22372/m.56975 type:complete len:103 (-) Transcript_22372:33-341(-)
MPSSDESASPPPEKKKKDKKDKKARKERPEGGEMEPPPPLDEDRLDEIEQFVTGMGGTVAMGKVSQAFEGVKRAQIVDHFDFARAGDQWQVSVNPAKRRRVA